VRRPGRWTAAALLIFVLASLFLFRGLLGEDLTRVVPASYPRALDGAAPRADWSPLVVTDLRFMVWLAARNAYTLARHPSTLFQAEQCFPTPDSLAFGETGIALGILGLPFQLLGGDPLLTFNGVLLCIALLAAIAMFLLVRDWTGEPAAGIVAGLVFSFHALKLGDVVHVVIWDDAWTVLALYFSARLFRRRGWGDALGLAGAVGMQLAGSMYPLLAAGVLGLPFLAWLLIRQLRPPDPQPLPWLQLGFVACVCGLVAWGVLGPYFEKAGSGDLGHNVFQAFRPLRYLLPGGTGFSGWIIWGLVVAAFACGRSRVLLPELGDPRWALLAGGLLVFGFSVVAGGAPGQEAVGLIPGQDPPGGIPNLYLLLAELVPGLSAGRGPGSMYSGVHLVTSLLAGLGAAGLLRSVPARVRPHAAALLILLAAIDTLRPPWLGLEPRIEYRIAELRPTRDEFELFAALARAGDSGPLLEVPVNLGNMWKASRGLLLSAYHHRPTSYCYNSFFPEPSRLVESLAAGLPERLALVRLRELGFSTVVVHHAEGELAGDYHRRRFEIYARGEGADLLEKLYENASATAYRLRP
jgi:hypothetical protein